MAAQTRADFTFLEIYRPVLEGMSAFTGKAQFEGDRIFGSEARATITEPTYEKDQSGVDEPVMAVLGVESPRLDVYGNGELRLPLVERRVPPQMNYGRKFSYALGGVLKDPKDEAVRPVERNPEEKELRTEQRRRYSLASTFEQIGKEYGVFDQQQLTVTTRSLDISVDPPLEHLGFEVLLVPDPKSKVTQMLIKQAGVCIRGLGRYSSKVANPWSPTGLRIPFARLPPNASHADVTHYIEAMEAHLPLNLVLGGLKYIVGGASWEARSHY